MSRESDYITEVRQANRQLWDAINTLKGLQREWSALDYATTLNEFVGENENLSAPEVGAVVFDTADAFIVVLNAGHATNMAKLL